LIQIKGQALLFRAHCDDLVQFECFKWSRTSRERPASRGLMLEANARNE
jgi:hypothetical protein